MLTHAISDPCAWRSNTIDDRQSWYYSLSPRCLAALDETIRRLREQPRPTADLCAAELPLADCAGDFQPVRTALEEGRGFAILQGPPREHYSPQEMQVCYWLLGQLLGRPIEQNVQGTLLYDVRDTGQDVRYGARFSVTNAESSFHTDNSFGAGIADYVGLLCLQTAKSGGRSQVVSGYSVHNELLARHPDELEVLYQPLHIDRRGGLRPGEPPTIQYPVLSWDGRGLMVSLSALLDRIRPRENRPAPERRPAAGARHARRSGDTIPRCASSSRWSRAICSSSTTAGSCTTARPSRITPSRRAPVILSACGCVGVNS